ncbi:MAG: response regulator [Dactylosporangium sp.]|nr:response regulator [Dactylosporangium sp.]NNJ61557.1 response regulator [Dactylosporangium sp.]
MTIADDTSRFPRHPDPNAALLVELARALDRIVAGDLKVRLQPRRGLAGEVVDRLNDLAQVHQRSTRDVLRIARVVGREGRTAERIDEEGYEGAWADGTRAINALIDDLVRPSAEIARIVVAVAEGNLTQHLALESDGRPLRGEFRTVARTVNAVIDQLASFADEVTRAAREVGTEGRLGGQAKVRGVSGAWRDLADNVNQLAWTLTTQLRAIAKVSTAVTRGDLTQRIAVEAQGQVAELTGSINQMIVTLRETTQKNMEQNWLDSNLARVSGLLQGQRDLGEVCSMIMSEVTPLVNAQLGAFFLAGTDVDAAVRMRLVASYGYVADSEELSFAPGEGLVGQAAVSRRPIRVRTAPAGSRLTVRSGLARTAPRDLIVLPVLFEGEPLGIIEFASVAPFSPLHLAFLDRLVVTIGVALKTILANRRTEELLAQSQRLTLELQEQSAELQRTNAELKEKAALLLEQKVNIEAQNQEIELARLRLEEKAQQLAQASQYKSEFLTNMSHELRTPLNSVLLLSRLLADDQEENLTNKQIDFARTIHSAGTDLLELIDDVLDLSKIEAGRTEVRPEQVSFDEIRAYVTHAFTPQAEEKGLGFAIVSDPGLPPELVTDPQWLQQILRNLLANAIKFTERGSVTLAVGVGPGAGEAAPGKTSEPSQTITFSVIDTGIGILDDKFSLIFEAFQQADGTTSRKYGGTGLGLSISRDLARLLGGKIDVTSTVGGGSTFTLSVPRVLGPAPGPRPPAVAATTHGALGGAGPLVSRAAASAGSLEGATVLIVDDDVRNVFALTSALELHGLRVLYADNGAEGIRLLTDHPEIDIVLMDAMMPDQDGNETTRMIRENRSFANIPVVFLTAKAMPGDRESSLAAGANDYITKPVDLDALFSVMATWAGRAVAPTRPDRD